MVTGDPSPGIRLGLIWAKCCKSRFSTIHDSKIYQVHRWRCLTGSHHHHTNLLFFKFQKVSQQPVSDRQLSIEWRPRRTSDIHRSRTRTFSDLCPQRSYDCPASTRSIHSRSNCSWIFKMEILIQNQFSIFETQRSRKVRLYWSNSLINQANHFTFIDNKAVHTRRFLQANELCTIVLYLKRKALIS